LNVYYSSGSGEEHSGAIRKTRGLGDPLLLTIIGTAIIVTLVEAIFALSWGSGPPIAIWPWFVPMIHSLVVLAGLSVAVLTLERFSVLHDPPSFWIPMGFIALSLGNVFYILAWPGLLVGGEPILARLPSTSAWISMTSMSLLSFSVLAAAMLDWPHEGTFSIPNLLVSVVACVLCVLLINGSILFFEESLPTLVTLAGTFTRVLLTWEALLLISSLAGASLLTRRYLLSGDSFLGYIALGQVLLLFAALGAIVGGKRYDLWWYLYRSLGAVGFLATLGGLFSEYRRLFGMEREKTHDLHERSEALRWETAFLRSVVTSSNDGILILDSERGKVIWNQRIIDILKIPEEVLADNDEERLLRHFMSSVKNSEQFFANVRDLFEHEDAAVSMEIDLKDETVLDARSSLISDEEGRRYGRIWTFRDITETKHYWEMLERLSATDGLTEIANRRRFDEILNREWRRSIRDKSPLSLILADIDFFKAFNDHYGHLKGDDCLRRVAGCLEATVRRPGDLAARYGGEEFACVLPSTDLKGAVYIADKIRAAINDLGMPHAYSPVSKCVTLSFGVATLAPTEGQQVSDLIDSADRLLYVAKREGRNRIQS
jgi:diguanylate cyclase (GGDEF)-like protein